MAFSGVSGSMEEDFFTKTPILKNCSPEQKTSCRTCAEACHSPFKCHSQAIYFLRHIEVQGGLAARSGTEFTWSPQLRNLTEWDWAPISLKKQIWRRMQTWKDDDFFLGFKFSSVQISRKGFHEFFLMEFLDSHGLLHSSWFGISASSVIYKLREFYEWPACPISYIFPLAAALGLSSLS